MRIFWLAAPVATSLVLACSSNGSNPDGGADASSDVTTDTTTNDATSSDAGTDGDAALSVPQQLDQAGKLALWLEATTANVVIADGGVSTWKDSSKSKNDATMLAGPPVFESAVQAGHDAVRFDVANAALVIADAASLRFGTDQFYITVVTRVATLRCFWFYKAATNDAGTMTTGIVLFDANGGTTDAGTSFFNPFGEIDDLNNIGWNGPDLADLKFHIVSFRRTAATAIAIAAGDGTPLSQTVTAVDVSALGQPVYLGSPPAVAGPGVRVMSLAEEIVMHDSSGVVADADVASVHAYLKQKYGL